MQRQAFVENNRHILQHKLVLWRYQLNHATTIVGDSSIRQIKKNLLVFISIKIEQATIRLRFITCHVKTVTGNFPIKFGRRCYHGTVAAGHIVFEQRAFRKVQIATVLKVYRATVDRLASTQLDILC